MKARSTAHGLDGRLRIFIDLYRSYRASRGKNLRILDIGCGPRARLRDLVDRRDRYAACDYFDSIQVQVDDYRRVDLNKDSLSDAYRGQTFDVVFCGEVIEHLFSPDALLEEIADLMHGESILIISTPNLGYYLNRLMLLFGISPFFLENSSELKLGRKFRFLGQGNPTEGHIRLFTFGAVLDLLRLKGFRVLKVVGAPGPWNFFLDDVVRRLSHGLAPNNVFVVKKAAPATKP